MSHTKKNKGFSLIEVLISVAIFSVVALACYKAFTQIIVYSKELEAKSLATVLVNEQFEILRNLPYAKVGEVSGIPAGVFPHTQTITRNGKQFEIITTIRNYDDPFDGTIGGNPNDLSPADSKLVEISATCTNCKNQTPAVFTAWISPKGLETASTNGALFVRVFDGNGQPIIGADVKIESVSGAPIIIEDVTNNSGMVQIIDVPPGVELYQITVSKDGYSTDKTYAATVSNPHPLKPHATIVTQQVTQISFAIDLLNTIDVYTKKLSCSSASNIGFNLSGAKEIGINPTVYKTNNDYSTNGSGFKSITDVEWDTYNISLTGSVYDIAGTDAILPISLLPGASEDLILYVAPKTSRNLLVLVKDSSTDLPLTDATVLLEDGSYSETLITNEGFSIQSDWSGGSGQDDFSDETKFLSSNGNIENNNPAGEMKLLKIGDDYVSSGELISSTFDIGTTTSASFIRWKPTDQPVLAGAESVRFQVASSNTNTATTTWDYVGPSGDSLTFYTTTNQDIASIHANKQFLRYKIFLQTQDVTVTPNISDVAFTYASACTPPGQVFFSNLADGTYTLTVSKTGYQSQSVPVTVSTDGVQKVITLSP